MRSVVMIAYGFPPEGAAGVYRPLRFVRHLPALGWLPTVVTRDARHFTRYDPQLLTLIPEGTKVIRAPHRDPWLSLQDYRARRFQTRDIERNSNENSDAPPDEHSSHLRVFARRLVANVESMIYRPDPAMWWMHSATQAAVEACRHEHASAIWATGGPWSSLVVARRVSRRTGIPFVIDLRDSWTLTQSDFERRQPRWIQAADRRLLRRLFRDAAAVVFRYGSEAEAYWRLYEGLPDPEKIHLIPNGYDGEVAPFAPSRGERCTVVYTGILTPYHYEGFVEGLRLLAVQFPEYARKLRVLLVGEGTDEIARSSCFPDISDIVEISGVVPFSEADRLQREADALLLFGWRPEGTRGYELGGSKIFSYLKAGRPILGILPQDENRRILTSLGVRTIASSSAPSEIMRLLRQLIDRWEEGQLGSFLPDATLAATYSAESQTRALTYALNGDRAAQPFEPGVFSVPPSLQQFIDLQGWSDASAVQASGQV